MEIDEGFAVGMSPAELSAEQLLSKLWLWEGKAESYGRGSNSPKITEQFSEIPSYFSELNASVPTSFYSS